jgi:hypothetical protein
MIDFTTALQIAQAVLSPLQQAFLQQIGKQAAAALSDQLAKLREEIFMFIAGTQPSLASAASTPSAVKQDPEELAAQILLAARRDPEGFNEILQQYQGIKLDFDASRSTGAISASASGGSAVTQNVILGGHVNIGTQQNDSTLSSTPYAECSAQARELLTAAALSDGEVLRLLLQDGLVIQAGGRNFVENSNPRVRAKWEAAICELQDLGFLTRPPDPKAQIFRVTQKGFDHVDHSHPREQSEGLK